MNKYQKALNKINTEFWNYYGWEHCTEEINLLQQLVDKVTPKKPIKEIISDAYDCDDRNIDFEWERTKCPHCDDDLINEYENRDFEDYDYCPFCGGRLDWSDENGK